MDCEERDNSSVVLPAGLEPASRPWKGRVTDLLDDRSSSISSYLHAKSSICACVRKSSIIFISFLIFYKYYNIFFLKSQWIERNTRHYMNFLFCKKGAQNIKLLIFFIICCVCLKKYGKKKRIWLYVTSWYTPKPSRALESYFLSTHKNSTSWS